MKKFASLIFAYFFLLLALIGVILPILPTVPFLLLSAWFAVRGSESLHKWLWNHAYFGKILRDWETYGAISRNSKILAIVMLVVSWVVTNYLTDYVWLSAGLALLFICVAIFILSRPEQPEES